MAYFQFFADDLSMLGADDFQFVDAAAGATLERHQIYDVTEVNAGLAANNLRQFFFGITDLPVVKILGLLVIVVKYKSQNGR